MAECNETVVGIEMCRDLFENCVDNTLCQALEDTYEVCGRQLYRLREAWGKLPKEKRR
jgi:hypothetical protein